MTLRWLEEYLSN